MGAFCVFLYLVFALQIIEEKEPELMESLGRARDNTAESCTQKDQERNREKTSAEWMMIRPSKTEPGDIEGRITRPNGL